MIQYLPLFHDNLFLSRIPYEPKLMPVKAVVLVLNAVTSFERNSTNCALSRETIKTLARNLSTN